MKPLSERDPKLVGAVGIAVVLAVVAAALGYQNLPFLQPGRHYSANFTEAGGLAPGAPVQVAGVHVGDVTDVDLDGASVVVDFTVDRSIRLGDRTEASIKTVSLLGNRMLEVSRRGEGALAGPIPAERTKPPYELPRHSGTCPRPSRASTPANSTTP
jgi:phospholipid/cholesterol/gamma-HCH transport system substrate-binding protein